MGVEASPEPQAALEAAAVTPEAVTELPGAPQGWHKKLLPKKAGTPRRRDVIFIAPTGEEMRSNSQLERYLKANPGGPALSDFVWTTGDTPRRSERLSTKTRLSTDSTEAKSSAKRPKRATSGKPSKENDEIDSTSSQIENKVTVAESFEAKEEQNINNNDMTKKDPAAPAKEYENTVNNICEDEPMKDSKEDEHAEIIESKEGLLEKASKESEDVKMMDAAPVSDVLQDTVVFIKDDHKPNKESTVEVKRGGENGSHNLQQEVEISATAGGAKESDKGMYFTEIKKDVSLDKEQDTAKGGHFSSAEPHKGEEDASLHVENVHSEADIGKAQLTPYFGVVAKPQEAHPAEVGVSS